MASEANKKQIYNYFSLFLLFNCLTMAFFFYLCFINWFVPVVINPKC